MACAAAGPRSERCREPLSHDASFCGQEGVTPLMRARAFFLAPAAALVLVVGVEGIASGASPTLLSLPQSTAFAVLGHSCGGIQEQAFAAGFDATSGFPTGDVYLSTRCGGSGRGGGYHTTTYSAWVGATWDLTGALVSYVVLSAAPAVDPTFSAFDQ